MYEVDEKGEPTQRSPDFHREEIVCDPTVAVVTGKDDDGEPKRPCDAAQHLIHNVFSIRINPTSSSAHTTSLAVQDSIRSIDSSEA